MRCYLLLIKGSFAKWNNLTEERRNEVTAQFGEYAKELGKLGYIRGGDGCGERSFRILSANARADESLVPPTAHDMVTGYFLIEVPDENEAVNMARKCPAFNCDEYVELVPCGH